MLPVMEWCIEDTEKGLLMLIKEDEPIINPEDGIYSYLLICGRCRRFYERI